jgi:hypothetical protein
MNFSKIDEIELEKVKIKIPLSSSLQVEVYEGEIFS